MKRIGMGIAWFVVFFLVLYLGMSFALSVYVSKSLPADANLQDGKDAVTNFMLEHAPAMSMTVWSIFLVSLALAIVGTLKGMLPGTRQKPAA
jgi:hypothetical protein